MIGMVHHSNSQLISGWAEWHEKSIMKEVKLRKCLDIRSRAGCVSCSDVYLHFAVMKFFIIPTLRSLEGKDDRHRLLPSFSLKRELSKPANYYRHLILENSNLQQCEYAYHILRVYKRADQFSHQ